MNKPLTVVATFESKPGREAELRSALLALVAPTRKEDGCLNYDLHEEKGNSRKFMFHENWVSQAHLDVHLQSAHLKALLPKVPELCTGAPEVTLWTQI